jgi:1,4-alpha-glucan branching enzyme
VAALLVGLCPDPARVLGVQRLDASHPGSVEDEAGSDVPGCLVRVFLPRARAVSLLLTPDEMAKRRIVPETEMPVVPMEREHGEGIFEARLSSGAPTAYRLGVTWEDGAYSEIEDPYRFPPSLESEALAPFLAGEEYRLQRWLGAHEAELDGVKGTRFAVWAPRAQAVNLMGSFNHWDARLHPMRPVGETGVWALFLPGIGSGALYKYHIRPSSGVMARRVSSVAADEEDDGFATGLDKADPLGFAMELRPQSASVVCSANRFEWGDQEWRARHKVDSIENEPLSIYEVHLGSWRRREDGSWLNYRELADDLLPYIKDLGFTHLELLPITEHPHDPSWGYQTVGYFAPTSRHGSREDFKAFVDAAHRIGLGVLLDWVPAHFPLDEHGLERFDGTHLYEHPDPKRGFHPDWGTGIFDYAKPEVISFLVSSARFWLEEYHIDGLRVDAVASMLYLDYSREEGEWIPNEWGGRENLDAVAFLRRLNDVAHEESPGTLLFAEESTAWPQVTGPTDHGGLGFDMKWNMGWMNDTLSFFESAPSERTSNHEQLTFSFHYAHTERFLLPLSHDEVVHLKRSLLSKMPGGYEDKFANLRLLLSYMWAHPGKKLLFMGAELGQWSEWNEGKELDWALLDFPSHVGIQRLIRRLNQVYREEPALHSLDFSAEGFEWVDADDVARGVISFVRRSQGWDEFLLVVANFSSSRWNRYRVGVPAPGEYRVLVDSGAAEFDGTTGVSPSGRAMDAEAPGGIVLTALEEAWHGRACCLELDLAPFSCLFLKPAGPAG